MSKRNTRRDIKKLDKIVVRAPGTNFVKNVIFPNGLTVGSRANLSGMAVFGNISVAGELIVKGEVATFGGTETRVVVTGGGATKDTDEDTQIQVEESTDEDKIRFDTAGSERMIIDNAGNVGIGVTDPDELLEVAGDVKVSGANRLYFYDSGGEHISANSGGVLSVAAGSEIDLTATTIDLNGNIDISGNVGIGTDTSKTAFTATNDYASTTFENQLSNGEGGGDIIKYGSGTTVAGELYYLTTAGAWADSSGRVESTGSSQVLAVALGTSPTTHGMLLRGFVRIAASLINGTAQIGKPVYVSVTNGEYDFTAPSSTGNFVRIVGYCIDTHSSDMLLYFNPDSTWVEIS